MSNNEGVGRWGGWYHTSSAAAAVAATTRDTSGP